MKWLVCCIVSYNMSHACRIPIPVPHSSLDNPLWDLSCHSISGKLAKYFLINVFRGYFIHNALLFLQSTVHLLVCKPARSPKITSLVNMAPTPLSATPASQQKNSSQ